MSETIFLIPAFSLAQEAGGVACYTTPHCSEPYSPGLKAKRFCSETLKSPEMSGRDFTPTLNPRGKYVAQCNLFVSPSPCQGAS